MVRLRIHKLYLLQRGKTLPKGGVLGMTVNLRSVGVPLHCYDSRPF